MSEATMLLNLLYYYSMTSFLAADCKLLLFCSCYAHVTVATLTNSA